MAGLGMPQEQIAHVLAINQKTLDRLLSIPKVRKIYNSGVSLASMNVRQTAYQMAISKEHPAMTMFWLKTRAGFRETSRVEISSPGLKTTDVEGLKKEDRKAMIKTLLKYREPFEDEIPEGL